MARCVIKTVTQIDAQDITLEIDISSKLCNKYNSYENNKIPVKSGECTQEMHNIIILHHVKLSFGSTLLEKVRSRRQDYM